MLALESVFRRSLLRGCVDFFIVAALLAVPKSWAATRLVCESAQVSVSADFEGGNIQSCEITNANKVYVKIRPESRPINNSPWYAFKLISPTRLDVEIVLDYGDVKHRYSPDISIDDKVWQTVPADTLHFNESRSNAGFRLTVPAGKPLTVAAQPLITSEHYLDWLRGLSASQSVTLNTIGQSVDGRPLWRIATEPRDQTLVLLGRQHPPETTGAIALVHFTERMLEHDALAQRFRDAVSVVIYPLVNPDGTDSGNWRHNRNGHDLNRDWGVFSQPENRAIDTDIGRWLSDQQSQLISVIDFHSTFKDVFYTQADGSAQVLPDLLGDWLKGFERSLSEQHPGFSLTRQVSENPQVNAAKHYFFMRYGVTSTTLEIGDDTDLAFIKKYARVAAETLMQAYLTQLSIESNPNQFDLVLRGGMVVDGRGGEPYRADVGILADRITMLAPGHEANAKEVLDVAGLIVAPGFIDIHTHARADLVSPKTALLDHYLTQGVTTVVIGNDGDGTARISDRFERIFAHGAGTNVAQFVGHSWLRRQVMDDTGRPSTPAELDEMEQLLEQALDEGAFGLSTGLFYADGAEATTSEVIALAEVAAMRGAIYESHIRSEGSRGAGVHAAIDEVINIAKAANIPAHIAHVKVLGKDVWGQSEQIVALIEQARSTGVRITADQYPWLASSTQFKSAVLSARYQRGGNDAIGTRLADSTIKTEMLDDLERNINRRGGAGSLLLVETENPRWHGLRLDAIAAELSLTPAEAAAHLLSEGRARVVSFNMSELDIETFMQAPWVATSSDGTEGHPRKFGSFPRKYARYVKEGKLLSLGQYVRAGSALPAAVLGLSDRGILRTGSRADVVVFDPNRFQERATFERWNEPSEGVRYLLVNGQLAIDDGMVTGVRAGKPLTRER